MSEGNEGIAVADDEPTQLVDTSGTTPPMSYAQLSRVINQVMTERGEYCGVPMPMAGVRLILQPKYPHPELAELLGVDTPKRPLDDVERNEAADDEIVTDVVNCWHSRKHDADVMLIRTKDAVGGVHTRPLVLRQNTRTGKMFDLHVTSLSVCEVYDSAAEMAAVELLHDLIGDHRMRQYVFRGCFIERSKRSDVLYMFRKGRPTIAFRIVNRRGFPVRADDEPGRNRILAVLCMHPIGYYDRSFAGAMTPTDDVIAHLTLMRADEAMFWRRSNQHQQDDPEAAL